MSNPFDDENGQVHVDLQRVEVEQRHAELGGGGDGNVTGAGGPGAHQLGDEVRLLLPGGVQGGPGIGLGHDPVLDQALGQAGQAGAHGRGARAAQIGDRDRFTHYLEGRNSGLSQQPNA